MERLIQQDREKRGELPNAKKKATDEEEEKE